MNLINACDFYQKVLKGWLVLFLVMLCCAIPVQLIIKIEDFPWLLIPLEIVMTGMAVVYIILTPIGVLFTCMLIFLTRGRVPVLVVWLYVAIMGLPIGAGIAIYYLLLKIDRDDPPDMIVDSYSRERKD